MLLPQFGCKENFRFWNIFVLVCAQHFSNHFQYLAITISFTFVRLLSRRHRNPWLVMARNAFYGSIKMLLLRYIQCVSNFSRHNKTKNNNNNNSSSYTCLLWEKKMRPEHRHCTLTIHLVNSRQQRQQKIRLNCGSIAALRLL